MKPEFLWIGQEFEPDQLGGKQPPSQPWQVLTETQRVHFHTSPASFSTLLKDCTATDFTQLHIAPKTT